MDARARAAQAVARLRAQGTAANRTGMARYGIRPAEALGVPMPLLRAEAKDLGRDHALAKALWATGVHEARILASLVGEPSKVTPGEMDRWAKALDAWDVCDQVVANLWERTPHAEAKAHAWSKAEEEYVKRAGFVLMARLTHARFALPEASLRRFLRAVEREAHDGRNAVKKGVNWALREHGGRGPPRVRRAAVALARRLAASQDAAERWVGADALREFRRKGLA
jgi:3-methyladenine DNA glycosylase AlkD